MNDKRTVIKLFYNRIIWCWFIILSIFFPLSALAAPQILAIDYLYLSSNAEQVTFRLNGPYMPKEFTLKGEKPRVVFDFLDVTPAPGIIASIPVDGPIISQVRTGVHKGTNPKTRVVLDLIEDKQYTINKDFDDDQFTLTVTVSVPQKYTPAKQENKPEEVPATPEKTTVVAEIENDTIVTTSPAQPTEETITPAVEPTPSLEKAPQPPAEVKTEGKLLISLKFDNLTEKGEMILFKLNGFYPPVVYGVEQGMPRAVCDFKNTDITNEVKTIKDVAGKYVRSIRVGKHNNPDKVRVVIDLKPHNNYDLEQVFFKEDNLFVIIINNAQPAK